MATYRVVGRRNQRSDPLTWFSLSYLPSASRLRTVILDLRSNWIRVVARRASTRAFPGAAGPERHGFHATRRDPTSGQHARQSRRRRVGGRVGRCTLGSPARVVTLTDVRTLVAPAGTPQAQAQLRSSRVYACIEPNRPTARHDDAPTRLLYAVKGGRAKAGAPTAYATSPSYRAHPREDRPPERDERMHTGGETISMAG